MDTLKVLAENYFKQRGSPVKIIMICDPNHNDLDDESALVVLNALLRLGFIDLVATIVANTNPEYDRARVAKGLLRHLGQGKIEVGVGDRVMPEPDPFPDVELIPYYDSGEELPDGKKLLIEKLKCATNRSITLVVQAAMTEVKWLLEKHRALFLAKVNRVVFMGGVASDLSPEGMIMTGDAMNVHFDREAALYCYEQLQHMGVPLTITTRNTTFKAMLNHSIFEKMGVVGKSFASRVNRNTQRFWKSVNSPAGSPFRGKLSMSRNREWFVKTFCGGTDPGIGEDEDITPYVVSKSWPQYDPINLIAVVPFLRKLFFVPRTIKVGACDHEVIGWSADEHGLRNPEDFVRFLEDLLTYGSR